MTEQKKTYTPPKLTDHGKVEKETKGSGGSDWEVYGMRTGGEDPSRD